MRQNRCSFGAYQHALANAEPPTPELEKPVCPDCGAPLLLKQGKFGLFYGCIRYKITGCRGSMRANPDGSAQGVAVDVVTKQARRAAHALFDQLWKSGRMTRSGAYVWLADKLDLAASQAHIGLFTREQCERVEALMRETMTEDELCAFTEEQIMGETSRNYSDEELLFLLDLPRDRDLLAKKFRGGFANAEQVCALLGIVVPDDEHAIISNVLTALRVFDQKLSRRKS